jgi:hypothetical protein
VTLAARPSHHWLSPEDCRLEDLLEILADRSRAEDHPRATRLEGEVPVYAADRLAAADGTSDGQRAVLAEIAAALSGGPGIIVVQGAFDASVVDRVTS